MAMDDEEFWKRLDEISGGTASALREGRLDELPKPCIMLPPADPGRECFQGTMDRGVSAWFRENQEHIDRQNAKIPKRQET